MDGLIRQNQTSQEYWDARQQKADAVHIASKVKQVTAPKPKQPSDIGLAIKRALDQ